MRRPLPLILLTALLCHVAAPALASGLTRSKTFTSPHPGSYDGAEGMGLDLDGDGATELLSWNGSRFQVTGAAGQDLLYIDGPTATIWKNPNVFVVRVGTHRYVALKRGGTWSDQLHLISLYDDGHYSLGQRIASLPFSGLKKVFGDAVVPPGSSGTLIATTNDQRDVAVLTLSVSVAGVVSLAQSRRRTVASHRGNGLTRARLFNGAAYETYLLCTDFLRERDLAQLGSWVGLSDPQLSFTFGYTTYNHVDSTLVVNRGSEATPDYWIYVQTDNGRTIGGTLTLTPTSVSVDVRFTSAPNSGNRIGLHRLRGHPNPVVLAGTSAYDLDGGVVAVNGVALDGDAWYPVAQAGGYPYTRYKAYLFDGAGGFSASYPPGGGSLYSYQAPPGAAHSYASGTPRATCKFIHYDAQGRFFEWLVVFNNQDAATVWAASGQAPTLVATQATRDANLAYMQQASMHRGFSVAARDRALGLARIVVSPVPGRVTQPTTLRWTIDAPGGWRRISRLTINAIYGGQTIEVYPARYNQLAAQGITLLSASEDALGRLVIRAPNLNGYVSAIAPASLAITIEVAVAGGPPMAQTATYTD